MYEPGMLQQRWVLKVGFLFLAIRVPQVGIGDTVSKF